MMKEIELKVKDEVKIVKEVSEEKQTVLIDSIRPHSGHKCFEYNIITNLLCFAEFIEVAISFEAAQKGEVAPVLRVMKKDHCIYLTALNKKNAIKRLSNILGRNVKPLDNE